MSEKKFTIVELPLKVPHFTTTEEVIEMCKSTTYEDGTMYSFPVQMYNNDHNINWFDLNKVFNILDQWCGFVIGFRIKEKKPLVIIKVADVPNGKMLLSLYDAEYPIYVCPVGIAENNKLLKVQTFRVVSN